MKYFQILLKRAGILFLLFAALSFTGCDGDDSGSSQTDFQYFPLAVNNSWDYNVTTEGNTINDRLEVVSATANSFQLESTPAVPNGIMTNVLSNGTLSSSNGTLKGTGALDFNFLGLENLNINVQNAALYDQNAAVNTTLFTTTGSSTQSLQGFNLEIEYTATTIQQEDVASMAINGTTYSDIIHSQLIINAKVGSPLTVSGFTTVVNVMPAQDVFIVDNYWAKDVGLIKSDSQFSYQLADLSAFQISLPFPENTEVLTVQTLTSFSVNQ
jgi:hypothetical protein